MIPFNKPYMTGREIAHVQEAFAGLHFSGDGAFTRRAETLLARELGVPRVLLATSGTHALEMAALLLEVREGDEVIVPSFTFVSTANAFVLRGARPVFADIRPDTLNLDERLLERHFTARTRVVVPVHYAGVGCDLEAIGALCGARGVTVVEDNAHGLFGARSGRPLGTFGALAALSFHETKNFHCGEGGALVVADGRFAARAEVLREKGTDRSRFFRGEVDKYTWVDVGSSWVPSDILAAFLFAQLEVRGEILARRRRIWERYREGLAGWAEAAGARLPVVPPECVPSWHMFHLLLPDERRRDAFIAHLKGRGVQAVFHYLPLHRSRMGERFGGREARCPVTDDVSARLVRLPFYTGMTDEEQELVIDAVRAWG